LADGDRLNPRIFIAKGLGPRIEDRGARTPDRRIVGAVHDDAPNRIVAAVWIVIARRELTRSPFVDSAALLRGDHHPLG
jgi:hypothetical protein